MLIRTLSLFVVAVLFSSGQSAATQCPDLSGRYLQCEGLFDAISQNTTQDGVTTYNFRTALSSDNETVDFIADGNTYPMPKNADLLQGGGESHLVPTHYTSTCRGGTMTLDMHRIPNNSHGLVYKGIFQVALTPQGKSGNLEMMVKQIMEVYNANNHDLIQREESNWINSPMSCLLQEENKR